MTGQDSHTRASDQILWRGPTNECNGGTRSSVWPEVDSPRSSVTGSGPSVSSSSSSMPVDECIARMIEHGLHPLTVLPRGEEYVVGRSTGWYGGAETDAIIYEVHPSYLEAAVTALSTVPGLSVAGLDVLLEDYRVEATPDNFIILEVNSQPGLGIHHFPVYGSATNAAGAIVGADRAPLSRSAFAGPPVLEAGHHEAPADADPTTQGLAAALQELGFVVAWHTRDLFHAQKDGITTAISRSYSALTGKAGVIGARQPRLFARLFERRGVPYAHSWRRFARDENPADPKSRDAALAHAQTLTHPALRAGGQPFVQADASQPEEFAALWTRLTGQTSRGVVIADVDPSTVHQFLVAYGTIVAVLSPADDGSTYGEDADSGLSAYGEVACRAVSAFPGLDTAEVTMTISDRSSSPTESNHAVASVRPGVSLEPYAAARADGASSVFAQVAELHVAHLPAEAS